MPRPGGLRHPNRCNGPGARATLSSVSGTTRFGLHRMGPALIPRKLRRSPKRRMIAGGREYAGRLRSPFPRTAREGRAGFFEGQDAVRGKMHVESARHWPHRRSPLGLRDRLPVVDRAERALRFATRSPRIQMLAVASLGAAGAAWGGCETSPHTPARPPDVAGVVRGAMLLRVV